MQKLQILFPAGSMRKLREIAKREDRPMSEIVRTATEAWLDSQPSGPTWSGPVPTFDLGLEVSDPKLLKELIYTRNLNDFRDFGLFEVIDPTADG